MGSRESRKEDVDKIKHLRQEVSQGNTTISRLQRDVDALEGKKQQLQMEMNLREDNYNRRFAKDGSGTSMLEMRQAPNAQQAVADWMLKVPAPQSIRGSRSKPK